MKIICLSILMQVTLRLQTLLQVHHLSNTSEYSAFQMFLYLHQEVDFLLVAAAVIEAVDVEVTTVAHTVALY